MRILTAAYLIFSLVSCEKFDDSDFDSSLKFFLNNQEYTSVETIKVLYIFPVNACLSCIETYKAMISKADHKDSTFFIVSYNVRTLSRYFKIVESNKNIYFFKAQRLENEFSLIIDKPIIVSFNNKAKIASIEKKEINELISTNE